MEQTGCRHEMATGKAGRTMGINLPHAVKPSTGDCPPFPVPSNIADVDARYFVMWPQNLRAYARTYRRRAADAVAWLDTVARPCYKSLSLPLHASPLQRSLGGTRCELEPVTMRRLLV